MSVSQSGRTDPPAGSQDPAGEDSSLAALRNRLASVTAENERLKEQIQALKLEQRHTALVHRDHAIGITSELETLRDRHASTQLQLRRARDKVTRLQKIVADMRASTSWRLGRALITPFTRLRGRSR